MPSPFPGMDPYLEQNPIFQELHTQILTAAQARLQPKLRPKYVARLERHLSEGSVWRMEGGTISLGCKEPDLTVTSASDAASTAASMAVLAAPTATYEEQLDEDELELRRQRRVVIYVNAKPRLAVASIELLSLGNKDAGSILQKRYLEKRTSALNGGLHWIEIDLLRGGQRPELPMQLPSRVDYLAYVAQATPRGRRHYAYTWNLRQEILSIPIPLLESDQITLDLAGSFLAAYDAIAADTEVDYASDPLLLLRFLPMMRFGFATC